MTDSGIITCGTETLQNKKCLLAFKDTKKKFFMKSKKKFKKLNP